MATLSYLQYIDRILNDLSNNPKWDDSRFENIKHIPNTKVGDVGQNFLHDVCEDLKIPCKKPEKKISWDLEIDGVKIEVKTASEDTSGGFQFNHFRYHRTYDAVFVFGISPNNAYFDIYSKADVVTGKIGKLVSMETGANASYKLTKKPKDLHSIEKFDNLFPEFIRKLKSGV